MKKAVLVLILAVMGAALFAQTGVIRELSGTVELKNAGQSAFTAAKVGDRVNQDTVISTALKSNALIEVGSTVISVRPLTRLTLTEIQASGGEETLNVNLQAGRVRVDVNPPAGTKTSMTVSSPNATASVRGTSFFFDTRNLQVEQGTVLFKGNRGYTIQTRAGLSTLVEADGRASAPQYGGGNSASTPVTNQAGGSTPVGLDPSSRDPGGSVITLPGSPAAPSVPSEPNVPGAPGGPYWPSEPSEPNEPGGPSTPNNPSSPNGPSSPGTPSGSGGPSGVDVGVDYQ
ncbi:MAG: FecR domain-containing protein [Treponema sp.]|nr:FecR domain-containing protein [Treponema sp.]